MLNTHRITVKTHRITDLVSLTFGILVGLDLLGAVVSRLDGLASLSRIAINGTAICAPAPFIVVQTMVVLAVVAGRPRALRRLAALLLAFLSLISVLSGAFDGSYAHHLTIVQRLIQIAIVSCTVGLGLAACRLLRTADGDVIHTAHREPAPG